MRIIVNENQFEKILRFEGISSKVIKEQLAGIPSGAPDANKILIILQNKINDLIQKQEKQILDKNTIKVIGTAANLQLQLGQKTYPMKLMVKGTYAIVIPPNSTLSMGGIPMSAIMPEIEKIPEYKTLVENDPTIKEQISNGVIKGIVYTDKQEQGTFKFTITKRPTEIEDVNSAVPFGTDYPLGEFLERNKLIYQFKNNLFGLLESGSIYSNLSSLPITLKQAPVQQQPKGPVTIKPLDFYDLFNFDDITFKDEQQVNQQIYAFIQETKTLIQQYGQPFIDHLKKQSPTILGYSSVDGDPDQAIMGKYQPCAGNKTRRDYDLCLSQERAKVIADILNKELPDLGGAFKYKGMGETTKWGPGWTKESPTIPEQTAPNRRYMSTQIAPFTAQPQ